MTDHRKAMGAAAREGALQRVEQYKADNPEAQSLRLRAEIAAYKPRSREAREAPVRAVYMMLTEPGFLAKSNAVMAAELGRELGVKLPANVLTEKLAPKQAAKIGEMLRPRKIDLDLGVCDTPSKIKKALRSRGKADAAPIRYAVEVAFSADSVTVGVQTYPIQRGGGVARIHVGRGKLNVAALHQLLRGTQ